MGKKYHKEVKEKNPRTLEEIYEDEGGAKKSPPREKMEKVYPKGKVSNEDLIFPSRKRRRMWIFLILSFFILIPFISAEETRPAFDMVYLLVENVFGGWWITMFGMVIFFVIIGMLAKMNPMTLVYFNILFITAFAIGMIGGIAALITGILCLVYFFYGLLRALKIIPPE